MWKRDIGIGDEIIAVWLNEKMIFLSEGKRPGEFEKPLECLGAFFS